MTLRMRSWDCVRTHDDVKVDNFLAMRLFASRYLCDPDISFPDEFLSLGHVVLPRSIATSLSLVVFPRANVAQR